jgi:hypothetical protein
MYAGFIYRDRKLSNAESNISSISYGNGIIEAGKLLKVQHSHPSPDALPLQKSSSQNPVVYVCPVIYLQNVALECEENEMKCRVRKCRMKRSVIQEVGRWKVIGTV